MKRHVTTLIIVVGCLVLALDVVTLGYAFTRGGGFQLAKFPGRIAVRDGCGLQHMWLDGTDRRTMCLQNIFDDVSVSRKGEKLAWDGKDGTTILYSGMEGGKPVNASVPLGSNAAPSLAPDDEKIAFLHSPHNDGKYDVWVTSLKLPNAEQLTNTRNVSDVAWSPDGDWIVYVQNWSPDTDEGQLSVVRPNGDDARMLGLNGDVPYWSPDGKQFAYVHEGSIWAADADGSDAHRLIPDGHSPAWSRDGEMIAFLRTVKCARNVCPERLMRAFSNGAEPQPVGPTYSDERQLLFLPDPFE